LTDRREHKKDISIKDPYESSTDPESFLACLFLFGSHGRTLSWYTLLEELVLRAKNKFPLPGHILGQNMAFI
jgi:hypothetical protein